MSSPISLLLDTMGIEELCHKYYISLRQSLFMASLYFVIIGNIGLLILTCFLKQVSHSLASCSIEIFRFLAISIVEEKNGYFCQVLPVFWAFPVRGPISITSRACERSNDGPKDRKCPKNGQNEAEIPIFQLNN